MAYIPFDAELLEFNQFLVSQSTQYAFRELHFFELAYVTAGACVRRLGDAPPERIDAGHYFLLEPGAACTYEQLPDTPFEIVRILFPPEFLDIALTGSETVYSLSFSYLFRFSYRLSETFTGETLFFDSDGHIRAFFETVCREYEKHLCGYREIIRCQIVQTIALMMRQKVDPAQYTLFDKYVAPIFKYCKKNYAQDITLGDIAEKMHFSLPYLSNKFKAVTGHSFRYFLQSVRMEEACRLLANTKKHVTDVAESVGYSDPRAFNKVFKAHLQQTPLQYRKLHRADFKQTQYYKNMQKNIANLHIYEVLD